MRIGKLNATFKFRFQDFWIGVRWNKNESTGCKWYFYGIWICLIPCFALHIVTDIINNEK